MEKPQKKGPVEEFMSWLKNEDEYMTQTEEEIDREKNDRFIAEVKAQDQKKREVAFDADIAFSGAAADQPGATKEARDAIENIKHFFKKVDTAISGKDAPK